jgi:hypothetical protein
MHLILGFVATALGLWAGGFGTVLLLLWADAPRWLMIVALPVGTACAYAMHRVTRGLPVRCPTCGGRAYYETKRVGHRDRIRYRCAVCKDVHPTTLSEGR